MSTSDIDERTFSQFICHHLNSSLSDLDKPVADGLFAARQAALAHHTVTTGELSLAGVGRMTWGWCEGNLRPFIVAFSLVVAVVGSNYVMSLHRINDQEDIDSAVLSDDLPLDAYLDNGFHSWLVNTSSQH